LARDPGTLLLGAEWFPEDLGGLNRYFRTLVVGLIDEGMPVRGVVRGPAADAPPEVRAVTPGPLVRRTWRFALEARALARSADLVDAHFALYTLLPLGCGMLADRPLVVHFHGPWADESALAGGESALTLTAKRGMERYVYRRADVVVALSRAFANLVVDRYGVASDRVRVIPPSIDLDHFTPGPRHTARGALRLPADAFIGVSVRRMVPRMGLDVLLDAWSLLAARSDTDPVLLLAGQGDQQSALERRARRLGIAPMVRFLGRVSDDALVDLYRAADVSIVPSLDLEGFGLVALEALACGTPVIASRIGGLPEALDGLEPDLTVRPGDPAALAGRLASLKEEPALLTDPGRWRSHASRFSVAAMVARHRDVYREAAGLQR
jgi:glycosyltransferase involved in cell wall biosynthesis